tara:strand:- start:5304 stop:6368 length:1065 start_codon:yes stop_codon:yes gene_type:complete
MIVTKSKTVGEGSKKPGNIRPKVIKWKGVTMVRNHSFLATVREIISFSAEIDVCRVGLIGDMHSGKSTLSRSISHAIHKYSEIPYRIKILYKEDLLNFKQTLAKLEGVNYILVFDDVSFLGADANKKQIDMVKQAITTIRHIEGGQDVKIIVMMNYHYSFGLDKYLRSADFKYITTVSSSENENMSKMFGTKYDKKVKDFKKHRHQAVTNKKWVMKIGPKDPIMYNYRDPFIPALFWNEDSLRFIVSPTRQFMDTICSKCSEAEGTLIESEIPVSELMENCEKKMGKGSWLSAIKLNLFVEGKPVYSGPVVQSLRLLQKLRTEKKINLEQCAVHYGLNITSTKLRKKVSDVVDV